MRGMLIVAMIAGLWPLCRAWVALRRTSMAHALLWAIAAWMSWILAIALGDIDQRGLEPWRFCALALSGCAGVAVLGARRPHVMAWNFVVLGLWAVLMAPLVESWFHETAAGGALRPFFLGATIAVGVLNYLPTRFGPAALLMFFVGLAQVLMLYAPDWLPGSAAPILFMALLSLVPWVAWMCLARRGERTDFDRLWLGFRDRWGLFWSQRVREQFNAAARNHHWPVRLFWQGLGREPKGSIDPQAALATLRAILQRFIDLP